MAYGRDEVTHEMEVTVEYTSAKARLVVDNFTGTKYWCPKSQTIDFNETGVNDDGEKLFLLIVTDWWWKKKEPAA